MSKASSVLFVAAAPWLLCLGAFAADPVNYLGPSNIVASPDGSRLYVVCTDGRQILVVDTAQRQVVRKIDCPEIPSDVAMSPDGKVLFVTCGVAEGTVKFVDAATGETTASVRVGHSPTGPAVSPDGKRLYVCNRFNDNVSVIDVSARKELAKVIAVREPFNAAVTPDGKLVVVTNLLPNDPADSFDVAAAVTFINTADNSVSHLRLLNGTSSLRGICVSPDGKYAFAVHLLSRYSLPTTQLERGWMNTNALSVIDLATRKLHNTVLLDEVDLGAAMPWDVACTSDGASICVTHAGTHELSVIDTAALLKKLAAAPSETGAKDSSPYPSSVTSPPNDLAFLVDLRRRIRIQGRGTWGWLGADRTEANGPRGIAVVGSKAYAAAYFSDKLAVVDLAEDARKAVSLITLGPTPVMSVQRRGEMNFNDAWLCFQHWQSCGSCHPDARVDGLNWDLLNDGLGNPKNTKNMLDAHRTPPAMYSGVRESAEQAVRSGFKNILFAVPTEDLPESVDEYLKSLKPVPSPWLVKGGLSDAAKRGKELFFSEKVGCGKCHPAPLYTDQKSHDVKSRGQLDSSGSFDTPGLVECWRTAPYMHDGRYTKLKDILSVGKHELPKDLGLSDRDLEDITEFMKSL